MVKTGFAIKKACKKNKNAIIRGIIKGMGYKGKLKYENGTVMSVEIPVEEVGGLVYIPARVDFDGKTFEIERQEEYIGEISYIEKRIVIPFSRDLH